MLRIVAAAFALSLSTLACAEPPPATATGPVLLIGNKGEDTVSFVDLGTGRRTRSPSRPTAGRPRWSPMATRRSTCSM